MKKLIIMLIILLMPVLANAGFHVEIKNDSDKMIYYWMYWLDHNWDQVVGPANIAGGELNAGQSSQSEFNFPAGKYVIVWMSPDAKDYIKIPFVISPKTTAVTLTPKKAKTL